MKDRDTQNVGQDSGAGDYTASVSGLPTLSDKAFQRIRTLVYNFCGINLTEQKRSLIVGRLNKMLKAYGVADFDTLCDMFEKDSTGKMMSELANSISTNHTFFYREKAHFEYFFETAFPQAVEACKQEGHKDLRIWCAGCSSGEEPYMLVMLMMEYLGAEYSRWDAGILATDISTKALSTAIAGIYPEERLTQLPAKLKNKYFRKVEGGWQVVDAVRKEVTFRRFNLMNPTFKFKKPFHTIFCRNVMIYFDSQTRETLVNKYFQNTRPGGYLFIGHSESLGRVGCPYEYVMPALYRRE
ncbi:MAG: CheR family methyltransferase [Desulfovibrio sp.]